MLEQAGIAVDMLDLSGVENYEEVVRDYVRDTNVWSILCDGRAHRLAHV